MRCIACVCGAITGGAVVTNDCADFVICPNWILLPLRLFLLLTVQ